MQENLQPAEKRVKDALIDVHSIFHTIQGEGPFTGTPAVFIRLAGCDLACKFCDTEYTKGRHPMRPVEVSYEAVRVSKGNHQGLVVITGGEPFRQEIGNLINVLVGFGFYVQIETNGTLPAPDTIAFNHNTLARAGAYIVVSPKGSQVTSSVAERACAYKYVLAHDEIAEDGLPIRVLGHPVKTRVARPTRKLIPVYLQPADMQNDTINKLNLDACVSSCMRHGYLLQIQLHKLIGVS